MRRLKIPSLMLAVAFAPFLLGAQHARVKDDLGIPFKVTDVPQRIISLAPNITEVLFALDLGERVIGVTRFCDYPQEALKKAKIGGMTDLSLERIQALNPELVIGFRGNPLRTLQRMKSLGLPVFVLEMGKTTESVFRIIQTVGLITKKEKEASRLIQDLRQKRHRVEDRLRGINHRPSVFFLLHGPGLWTGGRGSFFHDLVDKAGGINIAGNISRAWLHYNQEQLVHENPEVIIILSRSQKEFSRTRDWLKNTALFEEIKAVNQDKIYFLDENLATRPGPRIIEALEKVAQILHPEAFD